MNKTKIEWCDRTWNPASQATSINELKAEIREVKQIIKNMMEDE